MPSRTFESYLEESAKAEYNCMFLARNLPFIIEEAGIITSLLTQEFRWAFAGLIAGEYVRNLKIYYENLQVRKSKLESAIRNLDNGKSLEENALEMSEHWGSGMPFN